MKEALSNEKETVGPRTAYAHGAFAGHFKRPPITHSLADARWLAGYVAALEDLPSEALASLGLR